MKSMIDFSMLDVPSWLGGKEAVEDVTQLTDAILPAQEQKLPWWRKGLKILGGMQTTPGMSVPQMLGTGGDAYGQWQAEQGAINRDHEHRRLALFLDLLGRYEASQRGSGSTPRLTERQTYDAKIKNAIDKYNNGIPLTEAEKYDFFSGVGYIEAAQIKEVQDPLDSTRTVNLLTPTEEVRENIERLAPGIFDLLGADFDSTNALTEGRGAGERDVQNAMTAPSEAEKEFDALTGADPKTLTPRERIEQRKNEKPKPIEIVGAPQSNTTPSVVVPPDVRGNPFEDEPLDSPEGFPSAMMHGARGNELINSIDTMNREGIPYNEPVYGPRPFPDAGETGQLGSSNLTDQKINPFIDLTGSTGNPFENILPDMGGQIEVVPAPETADPTEIPEAEPIDVPELSAEEVEEITETPIDERQRKRAEGFGEDDVGTPVVPVPTAVRRLVSEILQDAGVVKGADAPRSEIGDYVQGMKVVGTKGNPKSGESARIRSQAVEGLRNTLEGLLILMPGGEFDTVGTKLASKIPGTRAYEARNIIGIATLNMARAESGAAIPEFEFARYDNTFGQGWFTDKAYTVERMQDMANKFQTIYNDTTGGRKMTEIDLWDFLDKHGNLVTDIDNFYAAGEGRAASEAEGVRNPVFDPDKW